MIAAVALPAIMVEWFCCDVVVPYIRKEGALILLCKTTSGDYFSFDDNFQ